MELVKILLMTSGTVHCDPTMRQVAHLEFSIKVTVTFGPLFFPILMFLFVTQQQLHCKRRIRQFRNGLKNKKEKEEGKNIFVNMYSTN